MNELLINLNKIHTTELRILRIKKNLELETKDVVKWCKNKIKKGKNWYINIENIIFTVNENSYTIITAHKIKKIY